PPVKHPGIVARGTRAAVRATTPALLATMRIDGRPGYRAARRAPDLAQPDRPRRVESTVPAPPERLRRLSRRGQRPRSAARTTAEGLRHRHVSTSLSGEAAVSELLDHRPPVPPRARALRNQDDRSGHVPPPGVGAGARRRGRSGGGRGGDDRGR